MMKLTIIRHQGAMPNDIQAAIFTAPGGTIGRNASNHLVLPDDQRRISRLQAAVRIENGLCYLKNMSGSMRVIVNHQVLNNGQERQLCHGDSVQVGTYLLLAEAADAAFVDNVVTLAGADVEASASLGVSGILSTHPQHLQVEDDQPEPAQQALQTPPAVEIAEEQIEEAPPVITALEQGYLPSNPEGNIFEELGLIPNALPIGAATGEERKTPEIEAVAASGHAAVDSWIQPPFASESALLEKELPESGLPDHELSENEASENEASENEASENEASENEASENFSHLPDNESPLEKRVASEEAQTIQMPLDRVAAAQTNGVGAMSYSRPLQEITRLPDSYIVQMPPFGYTTQREEPAEPEADEQIHGAGERHHETCVEEQMEPGAEVGDEKDNETGTLADTSQHNDSHTQPSDQRFDRAEQAVAEENVSSNGMTDLALASEPLDSSTGEELRKSLSESEGVITEITDSDESPQSDFVAGQHDTHSNISAAPVAQDLPDSMPDLAEAPETETTTQEAAQSASPISETPEQRQTEASPYASSRPHEQTQSAVQSPGVVCGDSNETIQEAIDAHLDELAKAFLEGAGIADIKHPLTTLDIDTMHQIGVMLRLFSQGAIDQLSSRSILKRGVKADMTVVLDENNNPFKLLPDGKTVLMQMFGPPMPGFMQPEVAVEDAMNDLQAHQIAMVAGMRATLAEYIMQLDPRNVERNIGNGGMNHFSFIKKSRLWESYIQHYHDTAALLTDDFYAIFGRAFLEAYDEEVESCHTRLQSSESVDQQDNSSA